MPPTDYLNCLQFYPPLMRVSPWLWFRTWTRYRHVSSDRLPGVVAFAGGGRAQAGWFGSWGFVAPLGKVTVFRAK